MKVIFLKTNKIKQVKDGYARNFLIPQGLAVLATKQEIENLEQRQAKIKKQEKRLSKKILHMTLKVGETGKSFGSITSAKIAKKLNINKKQVLLKEPIRKTGKYKVAIDLGQGTQPQLSLRVSAQNQNA